MRSFSWACPLISLSFSLQHECSLVEVVFDFLMQRDNVGPYRRPSAFKYVSPRDDSCAAGVLWCSSKECMLRGWVEG